MEKKFETLNILIECEKLVLNRIKFVFNNYEDSRSFNLFLNDLFEYYEETISKNDYKIFETSLLEIQNHLLLYGKNEFLSKWIKTELIETFHTLKFLSSNYPKQLEPEKKINSIIENRKNIFQRFYFLVKDHDHIIKFGELINFCEKYVIVTSNETNRLERENKTSDINNEGLVRGKLTKENVKNQIEETLRKVDKKNTWQSIFYDEEDFIQYRDILIDFFVSEDFVIPNISIHTRPRTISKVSTLLKEVHQKFSKSSGHLTKDVEFHKVVRILDEWQDKNAGQIYKAIYKG